MNKTDLINGMIEQGWDVVFVYNGKKSGLCSEVYNSVFSFQAWYGKEIKEYGSLNIETVIDDPFFGGKSIGELFDIVDMRFV